MSRADSREQSLSMLKFITPFLEIFLGEGNVTHHFIRKLAHFTEFFALGALLAVQLRLYDRRESQETIVRRIRSRHSWQDVITCMFVGLAAAVTDETIQIFSGRAPQVQDVLLDFAGVVLGIAVILVLDAVIALLRRKRTARHTSN